MNTQLENSNLTLAAQSAKKDKPAPKGPKDQKKPHKDDKPKPQLHPLRSFVGTVGEYGANPQGIYDSFQLQDTDGQVYKVKFPPHFGQVLHAAAQPGQSATVLGYLHTTPKGDEHLHLARVEAAGQYLRPTPPKDAEPFELRGEVAEVLLDPKGHPRGLRLSGEAAELRFPPHLGQALAHHFRVGAAVQASGQRQSDRPGELRQPGTQAPLPVELLTVGGESFLLR